MSLKDGCRSGSGARLAALSPVWARHVSFPEFRLDLELPLLDNLVFELLVTELSAPLCVVCRWLLLLEEVQAPAQRYSWQELVHAPFTNGIA